VKERRKQKRKNRKKAEKKGKKSEKGLEWSILTFYLLPTNILDCDEYKLQHFFFP
jgi:hypothetical protein